MIETDVGDDWMLVTWNDSEWALGEPRPELSHRKETDKCVEIDRHGSLIVSHWSDYDGNICVAFPLQAIERLIQAYREWNARFSGKIVPGPD